MEICIFIRRISHRTAQARWTLVCQCRCGQITPAFQRLSSCQQFPHVIGVQSIKRRWEDFRFCRRCCRPRSRWLLLWLPRTRWNVPHTSSGLSINRRSSSRRPFSIRPFDASARTVTGSLLISARNRRGHACGAEPAFTPIVIVAFVKSTGSGVPRFSSLKQAAVDGITIARPYGTRSAPTGIPSGFDVVLVADKRPGSDGDGQAAVIGAERPRPLFQSDAATRIPLLIRDLTQPMIGLRHLH